MSGSPAAADDHAKMPSGLPIGGKLKFTIDPGTLGLIREASQLMATVAAERIWEELANPRPGRSRRHPASDGLGNRPSGSYNP